MSGGSMGYRHEKLRQVLADHAELFKTGDSLGRDSLIRVAFQRYLEKLHAELEAAADMLKAIEWEDSSDTGPYDTANAYLRFAQLTRLAMKT